MQRNGRHPDHKLAHLLLNPEVGDLEAVLKRDGRLPAQLRQDQGVVRVTAADTLQSHSLCQDSYRRRAVLLPASDQDRTPSR